MTREQIIEMLKSMRKEEAIQHEHHCQEWLANRENSIGPAYYLGRLEMIEEIIRQLEWHDCMEEYIEVI